LTTVQEQAAQRAERANRRAQWMRQLRQWHWISGAVCLVTMLLFAATGITLNHSASIEAKPVVKTLESQVSKEATAALLTAPKTGRAFLPETVSVAVKTAIGVDVSKREAEYSEDDALVALPRPGGDAWVSIDRASGKLTYEDTDRGWIAYLNDLHKGRNAGAAWSLVIDVFAVGCIAFCVTGLLLLQMYAKGRPSTWPVVGLGFAIPVVIAIFLIH
jgi:uncharacterized protein